MKRPVAPAAQRESSSSVRRTLMQHREDAGNSLLRLLRTPLSSAMTILAIAAALLLPSLLFSLQSNFSLILAEFENNARLVLYLTETTDDARGMEVSENLLTYNDILSADFVSRTQALEEFSQAAGFSAIVADFGTNPLPSSIIVTPDLQSLEAVDRLAENLGAIEEVDLVQVDSLWLRRLGAIADLIRLAARMLGVIVALSLCFIVGNTLRMNIESRREEIKILKLIGGTHGYIARPFLYTGLFYGALGGAMAYILQLLIFLGFSNAVDEIAGLYGASFQLPLNSPTILAALILCGAIAGWFAAVIAGYRYINAINP